MDSGTPRPIRVAIADDHPIFRHGVRRLLEGEPGMLVVAEAADGVETIRVAEGDAADVLLLDVAMPRLGGLDVLEELSRPEPTRSRLPKIVILTAAIGKGETIRALRRGASGVVLKDAATRVLIDCIRAVASGACWVGAERLGSVREALQALRDGDPAPEPRFGLTDRELEIVSAVVDGLANRDIAARYGISEQTVKHHFSNIFDKTGVSSRLELALFALRRKLVAD